MNVNEILPMMIQQNLVTYDQQQDLINPCLHNMAVKQQTLCAIILGLPEDCVNKFLHCLLETSYSYEPHKQLYDNLREFYTPIKIV